jgi:hypothetical protein
MKKAKREPTTGRREVCAEKFSFTLEIDED